MSSIWWLRPWAQRWFGYRWPRASSARPSASWGRRVRPRLECLEDRITPTTFTPTVFTDGVNTGTVQTLRDAVLVANNDSGTDTDTIQLQAGTYTLTIANTDSKHETAGKEGDLNITSTKHALVIQGATDANGKPATFIEQTVADRIFQIVHAGATITFQNLVIEGGDAREDGGEGTAAGSTDALGGGILDDGGNLTLSNVVLQNNSARADSNGAQGGGIRDDGGNVRLSKVVLQSNSAQAGAAHDASGGGIYTDNGSLTITASVIRDNKASGGEGTSASEEGGQALGGGIAFHGTAALQLRITGSTLAGNIVAGGNAFSSGLNGGGGTASGGGVFFVGVGTTAAITHSTLSGNVLNGGRGGGAEGGRGGDATGGGVDAGGTLNITASNLSGNILTGGDSNLKGDVLSLGGAALGGGAYAAFGITVTITASNLSDNTLTGGDGAGPEGTVSNVGGYVMGGGVYAYGTATITASTLSGNTLTSGNASGGSGKRPGLALGGGTYFEGKGNKLVNSTVADNQVIDGNGSFTASLSFAFGGGLFFASEATATLTNDTVADNTASLPQGSTGKATGGGIDNANTAPKAVTLLNTLVAGNNADTGPDYRGAASDGGHNLIGITDGSSGFSAAQGDLLGTSANPLDPHLGPLQNNGGPTATMALLPGSPAINAGDNSAQAVTGPTDQRGAGFQRIDPTDKIMDVGAFEFQPPVIASLSPNTAVRGGPAVSMTITGTGFEPGATVSFGKTAPTPSSSTSSSTQLTVTVPASLLTAAGKVNVAVNNPDGSGKPVSSNMVTFVITTPPSPLLSPPPPAPPAPPTLQVPPLLAFFDSLLEGIETMNSNDTETITDSFFGIPLLVSTYDSAGKLKSVTLFGINVTFLFGMS